MLRLEFLPLYLIVSPAAIHAYKYSLSGKYFFRKSNAARSSSLFLGFKRVPFLVAAFSAGLSVVFFASLTSFFATSFFAVAALEAFLGAGFSSSSSSSSSSGSSRALIASRISSSDQDFLTEISKPFSLMYAFNSSRLISSKETFSSSSSGSSSSSSSSSSGSTTFLVAFFAFGASFLAGFWAFFFAVLSSSSTSSANSSASASSSISSFPSSSSDVVSLTKVSAISTIVISSSSSICSIPFSSRISKSFGLTASSVEPEIPKALTRFAKAPVNFVAIVFTIFS